MQTDRTAGWRRLSFILLNIEAILLVFPTFLAGMMVVGGLEKVWLSGWTGAGLVDKLAWTLFLSSLVAAWWLLLAYFYGGQQRARRVPLVVWAFAAITALLAIIGISVDSAPKLIGILAPGVLFVPTFLHLAAEVWLWPPRTTGALAPGAGA